MGWAFLGALSLSLMSQYYSALIFLLSLLGWMSLGINNNDEFIICYKPILLFIYNS
jgi:hypothetical protein